MRLTVEDTVKGLLRSHVRHAVQLKPALAVPLRKLVREPGVLGRVARRPADGISRGEELVGNVAADEAGDARHEDDGAGLEDGLVRGKHDATYKRF